MRFNWAKEPSLAKGSSHIYGKSADGSVFGADGGIRMPNARNVVK